MIEDERPSSVRITDVDGSRTTLKSPMVINDSIVSVVAPPPGTVVAPPRIGMLASDVNTLEVPRVSVGRTVALAAAIVGASITWARVQGGSGSGSEGEEPPNKDGMLTLDLGRLIGLVWGGR